MKTIKFHKSECGVEVLLNILAGKEVLNIYHNTEVYNTDYFELVFFKKARGKLLLNQTSIDISDDSIIFISAHQKRQWLLNEDELDFTVLIFQEDFLNEFFADKLFTYRLLYFYQLVYPLKIQVIEEKMLQYCNLLTEIKGELVDSKSDSEHIIRSLLYYLLQTLNREYAHKNGLSIEKGENNFAYQYKKLLEEHICEKQRISDYAALLGTSRISLNKAVKAQFNTTATQILKQRLLFEINNALLHSGKSVSEIAYMLHFSEPQHLMRFFKAQTGMTTTEYLSSHSSDKNH